MQFKKLGKAVVAVEFGFANIINADTTIKKVLAAARQEKILGQLCLLKPVASAEQVWLAAKQTLEAFARKESFSQRKELELLLRLYALKQVKELGRLEIKKGRQELLLVLLGKDQAKLKKASRLMAKEINFRPEKKLLEKNFKKNCKYIQKFYGLSEKEISSFKDKSKTEAIKELILEKQALNL